MIVLRDDEVVHDMSNTEDVNNIFFSPYFLGSCILTYQEPKHNNMKLELSKEVGLSL